MAGLLTPAEKKEAKHLVRYIKACITEDDEVTAEFLKNEIQLDLNFMQERGKFQSLTPLALYSAIHELEQFYNVKVLDPIVIPTREER